MRIITFCCQKNIFVYEDGCGVNPRPPYKSHSDIDEAIGYMLDERGIEKPKIIVYNSLGTFKFKRRKEVKIY